MTIADWKDIADIATPVIIALVSMVIIPQLRKINRRHFVFETKIDCIIYANKQMNGSNRAFADEWGKMFDAEYQRRIADKKFVENL